MEDCVMGAHVWGFFQLLKKRAINDKGDICVERDVDDDNGIMVDGGYFNTRND